jgi:predicted transcriptional regulator
MAQPAKALITFRIPEQIAAKIRRLAVAEGETQSLVIRRLIKNALELERCDHRGAPDEAA